MHSVRSTAYRLCAHPVSCGGKAKNVHLARFFLDYQCLLGTSFFFVRVFQLSCSRAARTSTEGRRQMHDILDSSSFAVPSGSPMDSMRTPSPPLPISIVRGQPQLRRSTGWVRRPILLYSIGVEAGPRLLACLRTAFRCALCVLRFAPS